MFKKSIIGVMLASVLSAQFVDAATIAILHPTNYISGKPIRAVDWVEELTQLVNSHNAQESRLNTTEATITDHESRITSVESTYSGGAVKVTNGGTGATDAATARTNLSAAKSGANSDITSLTGLLTPLSEGQGGTGKTSYSDGELLIGNSSGTLTKARLTAGSGITVTNGNGSITITSSGGSLPTAYHGSAVPAYASSTTITQAYIRERDSGDTASIVKASSTTVDITTTGQNGIAQSSLSGTVSVTASNTSTTFSASQSGVLQIGDVVCTNGGQCRRLASGSGTSWVAESAWTSTETTVAAKRGGRAPNTFLYLYAITDGTTPGNILSTRNVAGGDTLVDLPSGYTAYRQQAFALRLDSSANITPFFVGEGWPNRPRIQYREMISVLFEGTATTWTAVSLSGSVPSISKQSYVRLLAYHGGSPTSPVIQTLEVRPTGSGLSTGELVVSLRAGTSGALNVDSAVGYCETNSNQSIDYKGVSSGGGDPRFNIFVNGFVVTEVN